MLHCEFFGICSGVDEVFILWGRDAMSLGFWSHCFETLKWSHLKGLRGPSRPFDTVSHPRRMDAGYYNLLFQKVKLIWENIHTSDVGVSSVFG
jgi:hypothetical protein